MHACTRYWPARLLARWGVCARVRAADALVRRRVWLRRRRSRDDARRRSRSDAATGELSGSVVGHPEAWRKMRRVAPPGAAESRLLGAAGMGTEWRFEWSGGAFAVQFRGDGESVFFFPSSSFSRACLSVWLGGLDDVVCVRSSSTRPQQRFLRRLPGALALGPRRSRRRRALDRVGPVTCAVFCMLFQLLFSLLP